MTIDEAIARERQQAKEQRNPIGTWDDEYSKKCEVYAEEHKQLAEWLEELKDYQDKNKMVVRVDVENMDSIKDKIDELSKYAEKQYNKAIDDFVEYVWETTSSSDIEWITRDYELYDLLQKKAEKLKAGEQNGQ